MRTFKHHGYIKPPHKIYNTTIEKNSMSVFYPECLGLAQPPNARLFCNATDMKTICTVYCEPGCNTFYNKFAKA